MNIKTAMALILGDLNTPVVTAYEVAVILFRLYQSKVFQGEAITRLQKEYPDRADYHRLVRSLYQGGILQRSKAVSSSDVHAILGKQVSSAEEIACSVDPFAYVSHLSAMEWHGLTDRVAQILFISSPPTTQWRQYAVKYMQKDIGDEVYEDYLETGLPPLRRLSLDKILKKTVSRHGSLHQGAFTTVKGKRLRISTIGRTFLDMIRQPDLCGGIYHVIDVYEEHAERYLELIVADIDRHGSKIDKVRAGYILDERCHLQHAIMESWRVFVQRGGSRKLCANADYAPHYSEKWCLSLNIED